MLDLVQFNDLSDFSFKVRPIVGDDLLWHSKSTDDLLAFNIEYKAISTYLVK